MPLQYLFLDMNAFFASAEQQARPELRGKPVAVVPTAADTTCCIAASYEAKRYGVKTGTLIREARRLCPDLRIVEARPHLYVKIHRRIIEAVEACVPVTEVRSIDEMACRLRDQEQRPEAAIDLATRIKAAIARDVGGQLRCSIGLAPNVLLAKLAAGEQKPDGLRLIRPEELPDRLYGFRLKDFQGIGPRMVRRFERAGIADVRHLCALSRPQMAALWGSRVVGDRWWRQLRGEDVAAPPTRRRSVGHSHVLAPERRNDADARAILVALLHKAAARMRSLGFWAGSLTVSITPVGGHGWSAYRRFASCRDTLTLLPVLAALWDARPPGRPLHVGVVLGHLQHDQGLTPSLFPEDRERDALAAAMDQINARFGANAVYFGGMHRPVGALPTRIAFTNVPDV